MCWLGVALGANNVPTYPSELLADQILCKTYETECRPMLAALQESTGVGAFQQGRVREVEVRLEDTHVPPSSFVPA